LRGDVSFSLHIVVVVVAAAAVIGAASYRSREEEYDRIDF
jgi:hypothetical protein